MTIQTLKVGNQKLVVLSEKDYKALVRQSRVRQTPTAGKRSRGKTATKPRAARNSTGWLSENWHDVLAKAKANTRALTGKDHL
jgi:hypothetical protein